MFELEQEAAARAEAELLGELPPGRAEDEELAREGRGEPAPGAQPGPGPGPEPEGPSLGSLGVAGIVVNIGAQIAKRRWPKITFSDEELSGCSHLVAAVLDKYELRSALLEKYKEECELAAFLVGLAMAKARELDKTHDQEPAPGAPAGGPAGAPAGGAPGEGASSSPFDNLGAFKRGNVGQP